MNFSQCIEDIFSEYNDKASVFDLSGHDSISRAPQLTHELISMLKIVPLEANSIKVTGSKGKGSTVRFISNLIKQNTSFNVITLYSPQDINHLDRICYNNEPIKEEEFVLVYKELKPQIDHIRNRIKNSHQYLSPIGIFLAICLLYAKRNAPNNTFYVFETGRGCLYDEVGLLNTKWSAVTSLFDEHLKRLGPNMHSLICNKMHVVNNSETVFITEQCLEAISQDAPELLKKDNITLLSTGQAYNAVVYPAIFQKNLDFSCQIIEKIFSLPAADIKRPTPRLQSFGFFYLHDKKIIYDGTTSSNQIDIQFMNKIIKNEDAEVFISISGPKDFDIFEQTYLRFFKSVTFVYFERKNMCFDYSPQKHFARERKQLKLTDNYINELNLAISQSKYSAIYFNGSQHFITAVKQLCNFSP